MFKNIFKKLISTILNIKSFDRPYDFKKAVYKRLKIIPNDNEARITLTYVKGYTGKKSDNVIVKKAVGIVNVLYHNLLLNRILEYDKKSYAYRVIKHQLATSSGRSWGNVKDSVVTHNHKKYLNAVITWSSVLRGVEKTKKRKHKGNSVKVTEITGLSPRNFNLKNVLKITIDGDTFKNESLYRKIDNCSFAHCSW